MLPYLSWILWFIVCCDCVGSFAAGGLSLAVGSGAALSLRSAASSCSYFSCCGARAVGSRASVVQHVAQRLWLMGTAHGCAPHHVGSSPTRDRTRVPCIGSWILNHWTTRKVLDFFFPLGILLLKMWSKDYIRNTVSRYQPHLMNLHFNKLSSWFVCASKCEKHWLI